MAPTHLCEPVILNRFSVCTELVPGQTLNRPGDPFSWNGPRAPKVPNWLNNSPTVKITDLFHSMCGETGSWGGANEPAGSAPQSVELQLPGRVLHSGPTETPPIDLRQRDKYFSASQPPRLVSEFRSLILIDSLWQHLESLWCVRSCGATGSFAGDPGHFIPRGRTFLSLKKTNQVHNGNKFVTFVCYPRQFREMYIVTVTASFSAFICVPVQ